MELGDLFRALGKWWWLVLLCAVCGAGIGYLVSSVLPPVYEARVVLISNQSASTGIVDYASLQGSQQVLETYRELLKTRPVLETVITRLGLPYSTKELTKRIQVLVVPDTQLLILTVEDHSAQRAADIANEIVFTFLLQRSSEQQLQEIEDYEHNLAEDMRAVRESIARIEAEIERSRASPGLLTEEELARLQTNQSQLQAAYASLVSGYLGTRSMRSQLLGLSIVEPGQPPSEAIRPRRMLNTILAAVVGSLLAAGIAVLAEYLGDTIKTPDDVRQTLGLATLGTIGRHSSREGSLIVADRSVSSVAESFRILYTNLRFSGMDSPLRTVLVTSPDSAEGKSFTVANLAVAMAQVGQSVIAVDADLRHPRLGTLFGFDPREEGLSTVLLEGNADGRLRSPQLEGLEKLRVLPSGELPPNPVQMVSSTQMQKLLHDLAEQADMVLIDGPPILPVADAVVLAQGVDAVLLVLKAGHTRRAAARHAVERLHQVGANPVGVVLNAVPTQEGSYYYSYYGTYGDKSGRRKHRPRRRKGPLAAVRRLFDRRRTAD